jgi:transcriptional regulator with XRE-family HTH domain
MNGKLKAIRINKALTRKELANLADVNEVTIYRTECGTTRLRPSTIKKLAAALNVDVGNLLSEQGELNI